MRKVLITLGFVAAAGALVVTIAFVLETFRQKGDISLRSREKPGMKFAVNETLTHGTRTEATRWSADYVDEVLEVTSGRPSKTRRTFVSFEMAGMGPPKPTPLAAIVLLDLTGAHVEGAPQPFTTAPLAWPDPFYGALPDRPIHHFSEWQSTFPAAVAIASWLARVPATGAHLLSKLEPDVNRDGTECWRIRSALEATLEDGRSLKIWGDLFFGKKTGILLDMEWIGSLDGEKGEESVTFVRQRRPRK